VLNGIFWVLRCTVARPAGELWAIHDLLQSLRALAAGWHLRRSACSAVNRRAWTQKSRK
jgi:hypothetical protein